MARRWCWDGELQVRRRNLDPTDSILQRARYSGVTLTSMPLWWDSRLLKANGDNRIERRGGRASTPPMRGIVMVTILTSRARQIDMAMATMMAAKPPG
jgi:hypothetical protein